MTGVAYASVVDAHTQAHFLVTSNKPVKGLTLVSITPGRIPVANLKKDGQPITLKLELAVPTGCPACRLVPNMATMSPCPANRWLRLNLPVPRCLCRFGDAERFASQLHPINLSRGAASTCSSQLPPSQQPTTLPPQLYPNPSSSHNPTRTQANLVIWRNMSSSPTPPTTMGLFFFTRKGIFLFAFLFFSM